MESKVTYQDGKEVRVLRGNITDEDNTFITLGRRDGSIRINKRFIVKIEEQDNHD